jgi:hypothetical protein
MISHCAGLLEASLPSWDFIKRCFLHLASTSPPLIIQSPYIIVSYSRKNETRQRSLTCTTIPCSGGTVGRHATNTYTPLPASCFQVSVRTYTSTQRSTWLTPCPPQQEIHPGIRTTIGTTSFNFIRAYAKSNT